MTGFLVAGLLFFVAVWIFYDRRDRQFYDRQRIRHVHHCVRCGTLYAARDPEGGDNCPSCGFKNAALRF
ncbi:MAG: hydrogenase nickel incorporation protein HypA [Opitutales bacterium]